MSTLLHFLCPVQAGRRLTLLSSYSHLLRLRRSAQVMDGRSSMPLHSFFAILRAAMPGVAPFGLLPWKPCVHPVIFVHRVEGLERGYTFGFETPGKKRSLERLCLRISSGRDPRARPRI